MYRLAHVVDADGAGCFGDTLIPAWICVETLHAIYAWSLCVGRVDAAACIEGGFEDGLVALWTARVTSARMGGCCGMGRDSRRILDRGSVSGGGYGCGLGGGLGMGVWRIF